MQAIQAGDALSPTAFSLSVHNDMDGLFSMTFGINNEITVIAPCAEGIAAAFIEAAGMLQKGENDVLVLLYDELMPEFYSTQPYHLDAPRPGVVALRLALSGNEQRLNFHRSDLHKNDGEQPTQLLTLVLFLLDNAKELHLVNRGTTGYGASINP